MLHRSSAPASPKWVRHVLMGIPFLFRLHVHMALHSVGPFLTSAAYLGNIRYWNAHMELAVCMYSRSLPLFPSLFKIRTRIQYLLGTHRPTSVIPPTSIHQLLYRYCAKTPANFLEQTMAILIQWIRASIDEANLLIHKHTQCRVLCLPVYACLPSPPILTSISWCACPLSHAWRAETDAGTVPTHLGTGDAVRDDSRNRLPPAWLVSTVLCWSCAAS